MIAPIKSIFISKYQSCLWLPNVKRITEQYSRPRYRWGYVTCNECHVNFYLPEIAVPVDPTLKIFRRSVNAYCPSSRPGLLPVEACVTRPACLDFSSWVWRHRAHRHLLVTYRPQTVLMFRRSIQHYLIEWPLRTRAFTTFILPDW